MLPKPAGIIAIEAPWQQRIRKSRLRWSIELGGENLRAFFGRFRAMSPPCSQG
jgi:hypothetical protein